LISNDPFVQQSHPTAFEQQQKWDSFQDVAPPKKSLFWQAGINVPQQQSQQPQQQAMQQDSAGWQPSLDGFSWGPSSKEQVKEANRQGNVPPHYGTSAQLTGERHAKAPEFAPYQPQQMGSREQDDDGWGRTTNLDKADATPIAPTKVYPGSTRVIKAAGLAEPVKERSHSDWEDFKAHRAAYHAQQGDDASWKNLGTDGGDSQMSYDNPLRRSSLGQVRSRVVICFGILICLCVFWTFKRKKECKSVEIRNSGEKKEEFESRQLCFDGSRPVASNSPYSSPPFRSTRNCPGS
jgi:hypothetical protein